MAKFIFNFRAPFMAVFNFRAVNYAQCTASVIADYWAVSAAHCLGPKAKVIYPYKISLDS